MTRRLRDPRAAQTIAALQQCVLDLYEWVAPTVTKTTGNVTTNKKTPWDIVICTGTGTHTVTLASGCPDVKRATVKRAGTGAVTLATEGSETINGSATLALGSGEGKDAYYDADNSNWVTIP